MMKTTRYWRQDPEEGDMLPRPKHPHRSFYKSLTMVGMLALVVCLQLALRSPTQATSDNKLIYSNRKNASKYMPQTNNQRKLLQDTTVDPNYPEYCASGVKGDPYDPICPCDPTDGGDDSCTCPIVEVLDYDEYPCGWDVVCQSISLVNESEKCNFTETSSYCAILEGFVNYTQLVYCGFEGLIGLIMVILLIWWVFLFVSLAVCADDFFCTALVIIVKTLDMSPNVAGVTFLAFGNGAPDLFSAIAAFLAMKAGDAGLAIGGLFGAGIFVTTIIVGTVAVVKPFKVTERPFLRDDIFYLGGSFWMLWIIWRERIYLYDAIGFVVLYIVYVLVVVMSGKVNRMMSTAAIEGANGKGITEIATPKSEGVSFQRFNSLEGNTMVHPASTDSFQTYDNKQPNGKANGTSNGQVLYDNPGFTHDDSMYDNMTEDEIKKMKTRELGRIISQEIDAERAAGNLRTGTLVEDNMSDISVEIIKFPAWKQFLMGINPINVEDWSDMPWYLKAYEIFKSPIMFLLTVTVPVVNYEIEPMHNWNRYLQCFQCLVSPMICAFLVGSGTDKIGDSNIGIWVPLLVLGAVLAIIVFFTSEDYVIPKYHEAFGYMAFGIAMMWIYSIATEIVNLLTAFGVVLQLSNGILGLTLLAWGNSVGDFVADMVMARQGFPRMAFSACFGAPIFHLCLGTGIPFIARMAADGTTDMKINMDTMLFMANLAVIASMLFSLITLMMTKFRANKFYGMCLVVFYIAFVIITILVETNVIPGEIPSHVDR